MTATIERTDGLVNIGTATLQPGDTYPVPTNEMFEIPDPGRGKDDTPEYHDYLEAPDVARIAATLIARHGGGELAYHPAAATVFRHLKDANIVYRWKREGGKVGGKVRLGTCRRLDAVGRHFSGVDFLIALSADHCRARGLTARQIEALVFHELSHIELSDGEEPHLMLAPHDFEGFTAELRVYGMWRPDLKAIGRALQPHIPGLEA